MPITARGSVAERLAPLQEAFERHGRDPKSIQIVIAGAPTDADKLKSLAAEGVDTALLTIWTEDPDEMLKTLDEFADIAMKAR